MIENIFSTSDLEAIMPHEYKILYPMSDEEAYARSYRNEWGGNNNIGAFFPESLYYYYPYPLTFM